MPCFLCFIPLFAFCCCQGYVLICLISCLWLCFAQIYVFVCFFPFFMLRSASVHAYMLGFMFFHVYVLSFHTLTHALPCLCLDLCLCTQIYVFTCLCAQIYVFICLCVRFYALLALCCLPCACALHAIFVCLDLGYVCHAMCYCIPFVTLSFFLLFWPIGSDLIQTLWSLSSSIHLGPHQRVGITLFCMCMLTCFYAFCLCWPLWFQALTRLTPLASCGCVVTSNAYEALFRCNHLGCITMMLVALHIPSPFPLRVMIYLPSLFVPPIGFICIFTCLLTCPCMSLACECVVHSSTQ